MPGFGSLVHGFERTPGARGGVAGVTDRYRLTGCHGVWRSPDEEGIERWRHDRAEDLRVDSSSAAVGMMQSIVSLHHQVEETCLLRHIMPRFSLFAAVTRAFPAWGTVTAQQRRFGRTPMFRELMLLNSSLRLAV